MSDIFDRTRKLVGQQKLDKLANAHVLIVGIGGVGGHALEAIARAGVGEITIVDFDKIDITNINRQIIATNSLVGTLKVDAFSARLKDINPNIKINSFAAFYSDETHDLIFNDSVKYDYCVDCFDSIKEKVKFIEHCAVSGYKCISACGAGNRLNPSFVVTDIFKTQYDPLAKAVRTRLNKDIVKKLKVVCDSNPPEIKSPTPASISFSPSLMGIMIAAEVINDLL